MRDLIWTIFLSLVLTACGGADFKDKQQKVQKPQPGAQAETPAANDDSPSSDNAVATNEPEIQQEEPVSDDKRFSDDDGEPLDEDDLEALAKCFASWEDHPFKSGNHIVRKMGLSLDIGGFGIGAIDDTRETKSPRLTLIKASINIGSKYFDQATKMRLMNPNGWYCFKTGIDIYNETVVDLHCDANLADTKGHVRILSAGGSYSRNGVSAASSIQVNRIGGCE